MSVLKGLQDLLLKMGGTPKSGDNTDETVRKIADAYSGGGALVVNINTPIIEGVAVYTTDKTAGEIYAACPNVIFIVSGSLEDGVQAAIIPLTIYGKDGETYSFILSLGGEQLVLTAYSPDDYPQYNSGK